MVDMCNLRIILSTSIMMLEFTGYCLGLTRIRSGSYRTYYSGARYYSGGRFYPVGIYAYYYSFYGNYAGHSGGGSSSYSSSVCNNFEENENGSYIGTFVCPLPFEQSDFTSCCGPSQAQYCCQPSRLSATYITIAVLPGIGMVIIIVFLCVRKNMARHRGKVHAPPGQRPPGQRPPGQGQLPQGQGPRGRAGPVPPQPGYPGPRGGPFPRMRHPPPKTQYQQQNQGIFTLSPGYPPNALSIGYAGPHNYSQNNYGSPRYPANNYWSQPYGAQPPPYTGLNPETVPPPDYASVANTANQGNTQPPAPQLPPSDNNQQTGTAE